MKTVKVSVPATSANLGPGFDALGLALELRNTVEARALGPTARSTVTVAGEGEDKLPRDESNAVYRAFRALFAKVKRPPVSVALACHNEIPLARGLGSSGAAVLGGLLAANALAGDPLDRAALLDLATELEGHPDNVAPALHGGLQVAVKVDGAGVRQLAVPVATPLAVVLFIPDAPLPTAEARAVLPAQVPMADAVFNVSRVALLVSALAQGRMDLLPVAMADKLHQPARAALLPALFPVVMAARSAGAHGACLSGAGSTMMALAPPERAPMVAAAMAEAAARLACPGYAMVTAIDTKGATVEVAGK